DPPAGLNQGKQTKRRRTKESESSKNPSSTKETPKGKAPTKGSKTGKSASAKEPVEESIAEVVMDDAGDDVVHDEDQPQDASKPKTTSRFHQLQTKTHKHLIMQCSNFQVLGAPLTKWTRQGVQHDTTG
ncbi:hypothetical protein Tco_0951570, partial [Tanacetum coccineum]